MILYALWNNYAYHFVIWKTKLKKKFALNNKYKHHFVYLYLTDYLNISVCK